MDVGCIHIKLPGTASWADVQRSCSLHSKRPPWTRPSCAERAKPERAKPAPLAAAQHREPPAEPPGSPREPPVTGEPGPDLGGLESPGMAPGKHHSPSCPLGPQQTCRSICRKQAGHLSQLCLKSISFLKEGLESPRKGPQSWQEVTDSCFLQSTKRKFKLWASNLYRHFQLLQIKKYNSFKNNN